MTSRSHLKTRTALATAALIGIGVTAALTAPAAVGATDGAAPSISAGDVDRSAPATERGMTATKATPGTFGRTERSVIGADGRSRVTNTTVYPARAIGQIEINQDGSGFICTGWLIDKNTILTSGHCAYNPTAGGGNIIEGATFAPGRNGGTDAFGTCPVYEVMSPLGYRRDGLPKHDWAAMQLGTSSAATCDVGTTVGTFGIMWKAGTNALAGIAATVQGYPGDKAFGTQWTMSGTIAQSTAAMAFYKMDTFGGQSGSPVFRPTAAACGGGPCGMAVHSYGVGLPGPGQNANGGPRITEARFNTMVAYAAENG